jgi:hypothetical protein
MDAASRGRSWCWGEEPVGPNSGCKRGQVAQGADWQAQERMAHRIGVGVRPNPRMQPTGRGGPALRSGAQLVEATQRKRWFVWAVG